MKNRKQVDFSLKNYVDRILKTFRTPTRKTILDNLRDPLFQNNKLLQKISFLQILGILIVFAVPIYILDFQDKTFYRPILAELQYLLFIVTGFIGSVFFVGMVNYLSRQWLGGGDHYYRFLGGLSMSLIPLWAIFSIANLAYMIVVILQVNDNPIAASQIASDPTQELIFDVLNWIINLSSIWFIYISARAAYTLSVGKIIFAIITSLLSAILFVTFIVVSIDGSTTLF